MNSKIILAGLIGLTILIAGCSSGPPSGHYDSFAQCLTDEGAIFYGAYWCNHCEKVKKSFGDSIQYVTYVECDPKGVGGDPDRCLENDIEAYATFVFKDGTRLVGEPSLEELSQKTGCVLPPAPA